MAKFTTIMSARSDLDWCWFLRRQGVDGDRIERVMHDIGVLQPGGWAHWQGGTQTPSGALASVICATRDRILRVTT